MVHWIEAGSPRGAGDDPLAKMTFTVAPWPIAGTPDVVLSIPEVKVPATGVMPYQNPVVSTNLTLATADQRSIEETKAPRSCAVQLDAASNR